MMMNWRDITRIDRLRLPFGFVLRGDIVMTVGLTGMVAVMLLPLPPVLIDLCLSLNLVAALLILLVSFHVPHTLALSSFPALVLLTTLSRLALSVASTRLILSEGYAGEVILAFGHFVARGQWVVGLVVFLIITVVQLIVVAKGAERIAEVAARFTLDALPGKQMSVDADLRAGLIDAEEAQRRREALERESQFYGAMDGAMKFVKGDAIAGLIIAVVNLFGGLIMGVGFRGLSLKGAIHQYALLTIGDGLVAQIPSLLITTAAGIMTARVTGREGSDSLGRVMGIQILAQVRPLFFASGTLMVLALVPGLPTVPFFTMGFIVGWLGWKQWQRFRESPAPTGSEAEPGEKAEVPPILPIVLALGGSGRGDGREWDRTAVVTGVNRIRARLAEDLGVVIPPVTVHYGAMGLEPDRYCIVLHEIPIAFGRIHMGQVFMSISADDLRRLGLEGTPAPRPDWPGHGVWVSCEHLETLQALGHVPMQPLEYIMAHLDRVIRRHAHELLGIQDVQRLLEDLERQGYATLVQHVVPKLLTLPRLTDVLRRLLREEVTIRNMPAILETLAEWAPYESDPVILTEYVRIRLGRWIAYHFTGERPILSALLVDPALEETIRHSIQPAATGSSLALDPIVSQALLDEFKRMLDEQPLSCRPIVLCSMQVRYFVKRLLEQVCPDIVVLSFQEMPPDIQVQPVGRLGASVKLPTPTSRLQREG